MFVIISHLSDWLWRPPLKRPTLCHGEWGAQLSSLTRTCYNVFVPVSVAGVNMSVVAICKPILVIHHSIYLNVCSVLSITL